MNRDPATVLGFDYGEKRIGIAVGQTLTSSARPLETVRVIANRPDWESIDRLIQSWRPTQIIVGLPTKSDSSEHPLTASIHLFADELRKRYALKVHLVNEYLSSHEAAKIASIASGNATPHSQEAKERLDRISAQVILETWLAEQ